MIRRIQNLLYVLSCIVLVVSCDTSSGLYNLAKTDMIDPNMNLNRDDYEQMSDIKPAKKNGAPDENAVGATEPPVPDIAEILAAPKPPKLGETKLVSIAVTDDVPLKDVLIELARLADVDIEVDSSITGGISFRAKDRPFNEVIERIADLAALRYTFKNNVLRVERDTPYVQIYNLDFLNLERTSTGSVTISTNVLSAGNGGSGGGSGGLNTGSSSSVTSHADSDFWKSFEEGIKQILSYTESKRISSADIAPQPTPVAATPTDVAAGTPNTPAAATGAGGAAGTTGAAGAGAAAGAAGAAGAGGAKAATAATQNQTPSQIAAAAAALQPPASAAAAGNKLEEGAFYIMNRQASTLTVSATDKQHTLIQQFLKKIQENASSQVLIEAKIVEVTLSNEFQSGINWSKLGSNKISFAGNFPTPVTPIANSGTIDIGKPNQLAFTSNIDLSAAVQLVQNFGTTRTLSSPRLHAINNQEAVLTFAENHVYFELQVQQTQNSTVVGGTPTNTLTVNSTLHTVPIGIIMTLQPSINLDTNEITLSIRPTLSRITNQVADPAVAFLVAQAAANGISGLDITNSVPVIEVRELDSILKLKSGQVMVIGGLMQDIANNTDNGVPGLSTIPYLGNLFKGVDKDHNLSELVIFIRATIVDSNGDSAPADRAVYKKFTKDPRPLNF